LADGFTFGDGSEEDENEEVDVEEDEEDGEDKESDHSWRFTRIRVLGMRAFKPGLDEASLGAE